MEGLAQAAGISKSYVWELENREVPHLSAKVLVDLAKALGVTIQDLLGEPPPVKASPKTCGSSANTSAWTGPTRTGSGRWSTCSISPLPNTWHVLDKHASGCAAACFGLPPRAERFLRHGQADASP